MSEDDLDNFDINDYNNTNKSGSLDDKNYQITERPFDPEKKAKEEYMRKLMSFRKDELVIPEESEDDEDEENDNIIMKDKIIHSVEEAYELVDTIEEKMNKITNAIRGMDKRMSYNLRLLGSLIMVDGNNDSVELSNEESMKQVNNILVNKTLGEKKTKVVPKLKKMSEFVVNKLNLVAPEDKKQIDLVKKKL